MKDYYEAEEVAKLWDISKRQVQYLCKHGRIDGVVKFGSAWAIPKTAKKPTRTVPIKPGRKPKDNSQLVETSNTEMPKN